MSVSDAGYVTVARVIRSRGNRGEVLAEDLSGGSGRFVEGKRFSLLGPPGERQELILETAWPHQGRLVLKFRGVDSISQAEALRDWKVQIPATERGPAPEGEFFYEDLIGCRMLDAGDGREIGTVEAVLEPGGTLLLEVRGVAGGELLVPFAKEICVEIAPQRREIRVRLPEGLEDLNP